MSDDNIILFPDLTKTTQSLDAWIDTARKVYIGEPRVLEVSEIDTAIQCFRERIEPIIKKHQGKTSLVIKEGDDLPGKLEQFTRDMEKLFHMLVQEMLSMEMEHALMVRQARGRLI